MGEFYVGAAPSPKTKTKMYVIVKKVIGMGQKAVIRNLAEDDEGGILSIYYKENGVENRAPKEMKQIKLNSRTNKPKKQRT